MSRSLAITLLLCAYALLGILYSVTTPLFEAPDEQWHYAFLQHLATGHGLPVQSLPLQHLARQEGSQPPLYYALAAALTFWVDSSDYPAIVRENPHYGYDVPGIVNDNKNLFVHSTAEQFPWHNTALAMHLARLLSLAFGAAAVYFTFRLTLELVSHHPARSAVAVAAAALVAFNPQFLFVSSAVSNDSAITAASALALFLLVRAFTRPPTLTDATLVGIAAGVCALTKVSGLAMLILALGVLAYVNRRDARRMLTQLLVAALAFALVAGWWYIRNLLLYGEPTGTARMIEIFGGRVAPLTLEGWRAQFYEVFETFWIGLGWGNIRAPEWVYWTFGLVALAGLVGLLVGLVQRRRTWRETLRDHTAVLVPIGWCVLVFGSLVRWMMVTQAPHGRLFFPALPAFAALVALGWILLLPKDARGWVLRVAPIPLFTLALAAPFVWIAPAYALPPLLTAADAQNIPAPVNVRYDDSLMLLGSRVTPHPTDPQALQVELYWRVLAPMAQDYSLSLSALDDQFRAVSTRTTFPGHGTLPTSLMQAGQTFRDTYWLPVPAELRSGSIQVTVFDRATQQEVPAYDPAGNEITPIVNNFSR